MNTKKIAFLLLVGLLCFAVCSCKKDTATPAADTEAVTAEETVAPIAETGELIDVGNIRTQRPEGWFHFAFRSRCSDDPGRYSVLMVIKS